MSNDVAGISGDAESSPVQAIWVLTFELPVG